MTGEYELLGSAEKHVAKELRDAIETALANARKLAVSLEEIDSDAIESMMLDAKAKETVLLLVEPMQNLGKNLAMGELTPIIAKAIIRQPGNEVPA